MQEERASKFVDRGDSMDSNDSSAPSPPALHRMSSLYLHPEGQPLAGGLMPSTRQPKAVMNGDSDDDETRRLSAEEVRKAQEFCSLRRRSQSLGAVHQLASAAGTNKRAMLQALGLVLDSNERDM